MNCSVQCVVLKQLKMVVCAQGCHLSVGIWFPGLLNIVTELKFCII
jgi:hypothetical protein